MKTNSEQVWISVEVHRPNSTAGYCGRCSAADYEAMVNGSYPLPFLTLQDVHWVESVWSEADGRHRLKSTVYGRDGKWKRNAGPVALRTEHIASIALLKDCSEMVRSAEQYLD